MRSSLRNTTNKIALALGVAAACGATTARASAASPSIALSSFWSSAEHVFMYTPSTDGCLYEFVYFGGRWQYHCLQQPNHQPVVGSRLSAFFNPHDNTDHVVFETEDGHIHDWSWPDVAGLAGVPTDTDLTAVTGRPNAEGSVVLGVANGEITNESTLSTSVDSLGIDHVYYVDVSDVARELYHNSNGWFYGHQTPGTVSAANGQGMTSLWNNCDHLFYRGSDGNLYEDYNCGQWESQRLSGPGGQITPQAYGGDVAGGFLTAYNASNGQEDLWGPAPDSAGLALTSFLGQWGSFDLQHSITPNVGLTSPTASWGTGNQQVFYVGTDQRIYEPLGFGGSPLPTQPVMLTAGRTQVSEITAFMDSNGYGHIFYPGTDNNLREYFAGPGGSGDGDMVSGLYPALQ